MPTLPALRDRSTVEICRDCRRTFQASRLRSTSVTGCLHRLLQALREHHTGRRELHARRLAGSIEHDAERAHHLLVELPGNHQCIRSKASITGPPVVVVTVICWPLVALNRVLSSFTA